MLLLSAKILFLLPEPKQNSRTKVDNTSVRRFFAKPFVKRISCFCFFGTKKSLANFSGQKRGLRLTHI